MTDTGSTDGGQLSQELWNNLFRGVQYLSNPVAMLSQEQFSRIVRHVKEMEAAIAAKDEEIAALSEEVERLRAVYEAAINWDTGPEGEAVASVPSSEVRETIEEALEYFNLKYGTLTTTGSGFAHIPQASHAAAIDAALSWLASLDKDEQRP